MAPCDDTSEQTASRGKPAAGFTLIEILIVVVILGILATIVIPQFSNASAQASENTLKDDLRYLRTQIVVFKAQHRDVPPGYPGGDPSAATTERLPRADDPAYRRGAATPTRPRRLFQVRALPRACR